LFGVLFGFFLSFNGFSQEVNDTLIKYSNDFRFKEGLFLNFDNVIHNMPIAGSRIITDVDFSSNEFYERVLSRPELFYVDNIGNKLSVATSKIWGYARNGFLYVGIGDGFYRITLMGKCCHFIAYKTYEVQNNTNPYYSAYQYTYSINSPTTTQTEMQQYILDFETGNILEYDTEGIEIVLMHDVELYDEYMQLSNKKKKQLKFVFIRKYNQRNPLYLIKTK
jgi:hypothetical protein